MTLSFSPEATSEERTEVRSGRSGSRGSGVNVAGLLAAEGQLRQRHGLVGEALCGQHRKRVTCKRKIGALIHTHTHMFYACGSVLQDAGS